MEDLDSESRLFNKVLNFLGLRLRDHFSYFIEIVSLETKNGLPVSFEKKDGTSIADALRLRESLMVKSRLPKEAQSLFLSNLGEIDFFSIWDGIDDYIPLERFENPFVGCSCYEEIEMRLTLLGNSLSRWWC